MAGYCHRIDVTLLADGGVPRGRQRPRHPRRPVPDRAAQGQERGRGRAHRPARRRQVRRRAATRCRAACTASGVSVVNALVQRLVARGRPRRQPPPHGVRQGRQAPGQARGRRAGRRGAAPAPRSRFWPDPTVFERGTEFHARTVLERLQTMAFLNKGLEIRFRDQRPEPRAGGHVQVLGRHRRLRQAPQRRPRRPLFKKVGLLRRPRRTTSRSRSPSSGTPAIYEGIHGFANGIATIEGGMHEEGFKTALTRVVNKYARRARRRCSRRRTTTCSARTSARASPPSSP